MLKTGIGLVSTSRAQELPAQKGNTYVYHYNHVA